MNEAFDLFDEELKVCDKTWEERESHNSTVKDRVPFFPVEMAENRCLDGVGMIQMEYQEISAIAGYCAVKEDDEGSEEVASVHGEEGKNKDGSSEHSVEEGDN